MKMFQINTSICGGKPPINGLSLGIAGLLPDCRLLGQDYLRAPDKLSIGFGRDDPLLAQPGLEPDF
jgi:hypothetical protein